MSVTEEDIRRRWSLDEGGHWEFERIQSPTVTGKRPDRLVGQNV